MRGLLALCIMLLLPIGLRPQDSEKPKLDTASLIGGPISRPVRETGIKKLRLKLKTRYSINGRAVNQGQSRAGLHRVVGSCTLVNGVDTITINTSHSDGKQNLSFIDHTTYSGRVWSMNIDNRAKVYRILPLSATQFIVVSSDAADTATVYFSVEGE